MITVLNVKIDEELKREAKEVAKAVGLPMSTVVAASLREFVRTRSITLSDVPRLKLEVEEELLALHEDARRGKNLSPKFKSASEAKRWLEK